MEQGETLVSFAENAEDVRLWRVFRGVEHGYYVDVGAGDPVESSITKLFYDRGWTGINVEPGPGFERLAADRRRDVNLQLAVASDSEVRDFWIAAPDPRRSTFYAPDAPDARLDRSTYTRATVACRPMWQILAEYAEGRSINFMSIDVGGAEADVLRSIDFESARPVVVLVDAVSRRTFEPNHGEWEGILFDAGYEFAVFDGINRFYVESSHREIIPALAYPVSPLDLFVPAPANRDDARALELAARLEAANEMLEELKRETAGLAAELERRREAEAASEQVFADLSRDAAGLAAALERQRQSEVEIIESFYRSRTWRAGRAVVSLVTPFRAAARLVRTGRLDAEVRAGRPTESGSRTRRVRPASPATAYSAATGQGSPWHFPRQRDAGDARHSQTPLGVLIDLFGKAEIPVDRLRATRIAQQAQRTGWASDESLTLRQLSWQERQAVVEADALARLVLKPSDVDLRERREAAASQRAAVVVDARCLQDPDYLSRGVGRHGRAILAAMREVAGHHDLVLLTSADLPALDDDVVRFADDVVAAPYAVRERRVVLFVQLSPMTATSTPAGPFLGDDRCATVSLVYDFIPSAFPVAYLDTAIAALTNRTRIEALRHYDLLLPISATTEVECRKLLGADVRTAVTGVGDPLEAVDPVPAHRNRPYVVVPAGGDPRKNVPAAIAAIAQYRAAGRRALDAVVTGTVTEDQERALCELAMDVGLPPDAVEVRGRIGDGELAGLYDEADLVFVASCAEGFSIPVAEAVRRGTPVVASDIPAHRELLGFGPWLAEAGDIQGLASAIAHVETEREGASSSQRKALADTADPEAVLRRAKAALETLVAERTSRRPAARGRARSGRARLALVSPFPPQRSGVADYTEFTFRAVATHVDVDVFSAARSDGSHRFATHALSAEPYLDRGFNAVINVVGNSQFHLPVLDLMASYGGACIAHDNRMFEGYRYDRGDAWLAELVSSDRRKIRPYEIDNLVHDLDRLPRIGYDIIARQASPLIVHGRALADRIARETGTEPVVIPFVPYNIPHAEAITEADRRRARSRLGLGEETLQLATLGIVDRRTKGADLIVGAAAWLKTWGCPVHLHVVGHAPPEEHDALALLAEELDVASAVTFHEHVDPATLAEFLLAVDVAVQLRTSALLSLSGSLADCIAFGVLTVTTQDLVDESEAPSFVVPAPSPISSLLLAETIDGLRDRRAENAAHFEAERRAYLAARSPANYARSLLEVLGLAER